jgi:hypothetical protein
VDLAARRGRSVLRGGRGLRRRLALVRRPHTIAELSEYADALPALASYARRVREGHVANDPTDGLCKVAPAVSGVEQRVVCALEPVRGADAEPTAPEAGARGQTRDIRAPPLLSKSDDARRASAVPPMTLELTARPGWNAFHRTLQSTMVPAKG